MNSCTFINTGKGKYVEETLPFVDNIRRYFFLVLGIHFREFVADFIKDESGIWWLVNVKAFIFEKDPGIINVKKITHFGDEDAYLDDI
jgi:LMBR1 domain-containing protein 1